MKCFLDSETCGLHGMAITLQYAFDDGPITIHEFWTTPIGESLALIERICECEVIGFNLAFDWFHICKIYTTFLLAKEKLGEDAYPDEHIEQIALLEKEARDGPCVKPFKSFDIMLHARKTEFQITMERSDIRIRRVPTQLAWTLANELEHRVKLDSILFARNASKIGPNWKVHDIRSSDGDINPDFKDIVLKFKPSMALKSLAVHALGIPSEEILQFSDIEVPRVLWPVDVGYAPFALAITSPAKGWKILKKYGKKKIGRRAQFAWPALIKHHIDHWSYNEDARTYAIKDVEYTRRLYDYFGRPDTGDDDSELATMVGSVRWRGYAVDLEGIKALKAAAEKRIQEVPTAPHKVKQWISQVLSEEEKATFTSTGKVTLQKMASFINGEPCPLLPMHEMFGNKCEHCNMTGKLPAPESAKRAQAVLEARMMKKEVELYDKLLLAGRFHASFKVIGALSGRMAGADQLNAQGIKRTKTVREKFPLAFGKLKLRGGDFSAFEVVLADAAYNDHVLRRDLQTCEVCRDIQVVEVPNGSAPANRTLSASSLATYTKKRLQEEAKKRKKAEEEGKSYKEKTPEEIGNETLKTFYCPKCGFNKRMKIHALFGVHVYPDMDYDQIKATDGMPDDRYNKSKSAVFAMIYGGEAYTLMTRLGVPIEVADEAYKKFTSRYAGVGMARQRVIDSFCSIRQEGGIGSKVVWNDPAEYVESLLGFKRYFILENQIVKTLFELAENPPEEWMKLKIKVRRRDREQTASGAVRSALFGTSFQIQASNMRAAANHEIQSSGAQITKHVERKVWDIQPHGVHDWLVQPMNVHDQVLTPTDPSVDDQVYEAVYKAVESFRDRVPLIEFDYKPMESWASK